MSAATRNKLPVLIGYEQNKIMEAWMLLKCDYLPSLIIMTLGSTLCTEVELFRINVLNTNYD